MLQLGKGIGEFREFIVAEIEGAKVDEGRAEGRWKTLDLILAEVQTLEKIQV